MKKFSVCPLKAVLVLFLCLLVLSACNRGGRPAPGALDRDTSYAFGMVMAHFTSEMMGLGDIGFDYNAFMEGFRAFKEARETRLTWDSAMDRVNTFFEMLHIERNEAFLVENGRQSGVVTTSSGLQYEVLFQGDGEKPGPHDTVLVHYEGTLINGTIFDSSYLRGRPVEINLQSAIPGWTEGIQLMNERSNFRFVIPSHLAYGSGGAGESIPPNSTLIFRVELFSIMR